MGAELNGGGRRWGMWPCVNDPNLFSVRIAARVRRQSQIQMSDAKVEFFTFDHEPATPDKEQLLAFACLSTSAGRNLPLHRRPHRAEMRWAEPQRRRRALGLGRQSRAPNVLAIHQMSDLMAQLHPQRALR
jgi:hypothetical protein